MKLLAEAGIYVLIVGLRCHAQCTVPRLTQLQGLSTATNTINRAAPTTSYNPRLLDEYFTTIDCMAEYRNTLGVIVADGIINSSQSTAAAPVVKAVARDVKRYMSAAADATGQRRLPVGYSASTCRLVLKSSFDYLTAGEPEDSIDFFCVSLTLAWDMWQISTLTSYLVQQLQLVRPVNDAHLRL
jgi:1,3-beta-glucanosyltransferase GAS5